MLIICTPASPSYSLQMPPNESSLYLLSPSPAPLGGGVAHYAQPTEMLVAFLQLPTVPLSSQVHWPRRVLSTALHSSFPALHSFGSFCNAPCACGRATQSPL